MHKEKLYENTLFSEEEAKADMWFTKTIDTTLTN